MTKIEQELCNACVKRYMKQTEWERVDREGENYPRHLKKIQSEIDMLGIDIDILSGELAEEREA